MATLYSSAGAVLTLGGALLSQPAIGAAWTLGGAVKVSPAAGAVVTLGGTLILDPPQRTVEQNAHYLLAGGPDIFNSGNTETLLCLGLGGRTVEWGFLQEGSDLDTTDLEVIPGEDGRAAAVVFRLQRTEVVLTAIFLTSTLPRRGATLTWLNMDGTPVTARILNRRRLYSMNGASSVAITATKWDGLP